MKSNLCCLGTGVSYGKLQNIEALIELFDYVQRMSNKTLTSKTAKDTRIKMCKVMVTQIVIDGSQTGVHVRNNMIGAQAIFKKI